MYYDFTVPIPKVKGKITRMKKGTITYIFNLKPDVLIFLRGSIQSLSVSVSARLIPTIRI